MFTSSWQIPHRTRINHRIWSGLVWSGLVWSGSSSSSSTYEAGPLIIFSGRDSFVKGISLDFTINFKGQPLSMVMYHELWDFFLAFLIQEQGSYDKSLNSYYLYLIYFVYSCATNLSVSRCATMTKALLVRICPTMLLDQKWSTR